MLLGRAEEAEADLTKAIRLSPRDPGLDRWQALLGIADLFLGRLESAVDRLSKSVEINPNVSHAPFLPSCGLGAGRPLYRGAGGAERRPPARPELYCRQISQRARAVKTRPSLPSASVSTRA